MNERPVRSLPLLALVLAAAPLSAQYAGSADPFSVWDHADNPAAWSLFPDAVAFGLQGEAAASDVASYDGNAIDGDVRMVYGVPGFLYRYSVIGGDKAHELTGAAGFSTMVGFGLRFRWDGESGAAPFGYLVDAGLMFRPTNFASLALGYVDGYDASGDHAPGYRFGLAVRPLAFYPRLESTLTLSADASAAGGVFSFDAVGARYVLDDWLSLHGRYSLTDSSLGVGVSVALSGMESSAGLSMPDGAVSVGDGRVSLGQSVRVGRATKAASRVFGLSTLLIDEPGAWATTPPRFDYDPGFGDDVGLWFGQAVAAIDRAAADASIDTLVMVEPPLFDSEARAQDFARALERFQKAGKPVYVYARSMDRLSYIYAAAGADLVAFDPNGMLAVLEVSSFSLYLKGLLGKLGIDVYNLRSHDTKTAGNMLSESGITEAERAMKERYVGGLASQGWTALDAARGKKLAGPAAEAIGAGPFLDPRKAVEAGLVDALMYRDEFDDAVTEKTGGAPTVDIRSYARERGLSWGQPVAKKVAVVYLSGSIIEDRGVAGQSIGDSATELLAQLREDPIVSGVILRVDSGGGSALTSDHIAREVKRLREAGKPVVVSMASYAASGGYYISANADRIFAEAGTLTGSIGVIGLDFSVVRMLDKLGVGADIVSAGPSGAFGNPFMPRRDTDEAALRSYIYYVYDRFVDVVADGRKMDRAKVDELGKGQVWLGSEAVKNGLVDAIGGIDDAKAAIGELIGAKTRFVDYVPGDSGMGPLLGLLGARLGLESRQAGLVAGAIDEAVRFADDIAAMGDGLLYLAPEYLYREGHRVP